MSELLQTLARCQLWYNKVVARSDLEKIVFRELEPQETYDWVSPLGDRNQPATEARMTTTRPMMMLQLQEEFSI
jgi:hypothetical protein